MKKQLPVVGPSSSLRADGGRNWVHPADVKGRWTSVRRWVFGLLLLVYVGLPFIPVGGHPAVFIDIPDRHLYLFGLTFNAQDAWLAFFLVTGVGFLLIVLAALLGRIWCGYACPQTVFLEGVFRRIERLIEGPRSKRIRRNEGPFTFDKAWRKVLKHAVFLFLAIAIAHVFLSYFTSTTELQVMVFQSPSEHLEAFIWVWSITAVLYLNFAFFREQLCLVVCPYGRLQSVLADRDSIVVGYDEARGEPRGKAKDPNAGDCVSCNRCVVVCPTGIDIRNGLQLDCIGCANCIDACDEVMIKLKREPGLIRYDSHNGLQGQERRFIRPRVFLYAALGAVGMIVATFALTSRQPFEAQGIRRQGSPFSIVEDRVLNSFEVHLVNKQDSPLTFRFQPVDPGEFDVRLSQPEVTVQALGSVRVPVTVLIDRESQEPGVPVLLDVSSEVESETETIRLELPFLGPRR